MSKTTLLSKRQSGVGSHKKNDRHIIALSGGMASAWVAQWAKSNLPIEKTVYYFNDTKWEHPDLYRFLNDLERVLDIKITYDNDGRTPEDVFYDNKMLGSNRTPICSKILKAKKLQEFVNIGDTVYFGIDITEIHRAARITPIYERLGCFVKFPLIDNQAFKKEIFETVENYGILKPQLYRDGFLHNNCSGGCVRSGKRQWVSLYKSYPEVYADRERIETEFTKWNNKRRLEKDPSYIPRDYHFMKDMSLKKLREIIDNQYEIDFNNDGDSHGECIGICGDMA